MLKIRISLIVLSAMILDLGINPPRLIADESRSKKTTKEQNASDKKPSRKRKVQMCEECGKPEPECTCTGEKHEKAKHDGHDHSGDKAKAKENN